MQSVEVAVAAPSEDRNPLLVFTRQELVNAFRQWEQEVDEKGAQDVIGEQLHEGQADYLISLLNANKP